ncbi:centrosomal protein of 120 kDa [Phymastichus coffea]|uniref:centrosomal protein of 120 kDa n=1 Tax=Phymastichus coffea TaxID=108790 RepID=UPI00273AD130|nr:centrosomal protein of 120 kDa [Phymastichus coffea]
MEDFTNPNLQLVLGVREGTNFDRVQKPTIVIATLNGTCLETKKIQSDSNPQYTTDLIWETDRNAIRKMRSNQTPIKVECYGVNENGSREKLGYILLSVRCAQIIHYNEDSKIKTNWHNVLGLRNEFNNCKPKLLLFLIIKEKEIKPIDVVPQVKSAHQYNLIHSQITPVWLKEEQLIQLGPIETCHDLFLLTIIIESANNLIQLIPNVSELEKDHFSFFYNILDTIISVKPFRLVSNNIYFNEKEVIKIRSSYSTLIHYLNTKPYFFIKLKKGNMIIAQSEIDMKSFIAVNYTEDLKQFQKNMPFTADYCCILQSVHSKDHKLSTENVQDNDFLPNLKLHMTLLQFDMKDDLPKKRIPYTQHSPPLHRSKSDVSILNQTNGIEQISYSNTQMRTTSDHLILDNIKTLNNRVPRSRIEKEIIFSHKNTQTTNNDSNSDSEKHCQIVNLHKRYSLNIDLKEIKFIHDRPDIERIEFRFYDDAGDLISTTCKNVSIIPEEIITLQDVKCKFYFMSASNEIEGLMKTFTPKICISDVTTSEKKCIAQISLDIHKFICDRMEDSEQIVPLIECHNNKVVGCVKINVSIQDHTALVLHKLKEGISGITLDNGLAYKIVEELETWKDRQKEIFKDELRKKEEAYLNLLNEKWQQRRKCLETKFGSSIEQCKILSNKLNMTIENLRVRKIQSLEKETKLIQANDELYWKYDRKVNQLQDALQKMQGEFSTKLISLEEENKNLISQVKLLTEQKCELEKIKAEQAQKLSIQNKISLTEDQTTSIFHQLKNLEEQLDSAQKSKSFFKEQWSKAVKEIHRTKMENQQALETQIKSDKEDLNNLDLEEILDADTAALTCDQIALSQIQREIDIINPDSAMQYCSRKADRQLFVPQSDLFIPIDKNLVHSSTSATSSSSDRKLNMLIEERDSLLKTGNYSSNDSLIIKLNTEIRSILMNS